MARWPDSDRRRVAGIVASLGLPQRGRALDFGCGAGVFAAVLAEVLPGWEVWGTDISPVALDQARARVPGVRFAAPTEVAGAFDLIFSHHVLEHVTDLAGTMAHLARLTAPAGAMLHVLPCGNPGSLEHRIVEATPGGVTPRGCWFYEDPTHERRVTTADLAAAFARHGFHLAGAWYANQEDGAVEWITASGPRFVWRMLRALPQLRLRLVVLSALRFPARALRRFQQGDRRAVHYVAAAVGLVAYPVSSRVNRRVLARADTEWSRRRLDPAGSVQYLHVRR